MDKKKFKNSYKTTNNSVFEIKDLFFFIQGDISIQEYTTRAGCIGLKQARKMRLSSASRQTL